MPQLILIAAVSEDGFISSGQGIPWHLPADIEHFRAATAGQWLLLGRRTFEEMQGWFQPGHMPLVLSRRPAGLGEPGVAVSSVADALAKAAAQPALWVCGGGEVYAQAMPLADRLVITRVRTQLGVGVAFPAIDPAVWQILSQRHHPADGQHPHAMDFIEMTRRSAGSGL